MRKETHYIAAMDSNKATIRLFGELGGDVNGNYLAQDIAWAGESCSEIELHINSSGGSVLQGLSVIAAIQTTGAHVHGKILGVAASMAGVIAMACDTISMVDFGRIMIHDPRIKGGNPTEKQIKAVENMRGMLSSIYINRTGMSEEEISKIMEEETWLNAEEALEMGFVDKVLKTDKKADLAPAASMEEVMALASKEYQSKNPGNMSKNMISLVAIAAAFEGLGEDATEDQVLAAIQAKDSKIADLEAQIEKAPKKEELDQLKASLEAALKAKATVKVEALIKEGRLDASKKEALIEAALKDEGSFDALVEAMPQTAPRISAHLEQGGDERKDWTFDDYQKKAPEALASMQKEDPEKFEKLFEAHFGPIND